MHKCTLTDISKWMDVTSEAANFQLVDFYAFLRPFYHWLPYWLVSNKRKLHHLQQLEDRVFNQLLNRAKESIETGQNSPSTTPASFLNIFLIISRLHS